MTAIAEYSPMLQQYFGMKQRHRDAILLARVGDFYEAYGEDAERIARLLSITLTSKEAGKGQRVAMAGVPHHALDGYLAKLVAGKHIVALAEQLEPPVANRLVRRDVVRIVTPGTIVEDQCLERGANTYLAALSVIGDAFALAHADVSTGECAVMAVSGENALDEIAVELARLVPAELVADVNGEVCEFLRPTLDVAATHLASPSLSAVTSSPSVRYEGFSLDESVAVGRALDALETYVARVGLGVGAAPSLRKPVPYRPRAFLSLDGPTRRNLEITKTLGANPHATLLATVDRCRTGMGSRALTRRLLAPEVERAEIARRADGVEEFVRDLALRTRAQEILDDVADLERLAQKIRFRRTLPRELAALRRTLGALHTLREALAGRFERHLERIGEFGELEADLHATLVENPPVSLADGGVVCPGADPELAECAALRGDARAKLVELEERERTRTGIKNLKVKYAAPFGYAIEVGKAQAASVPADYVRKQTLTNGERFITPELKDLESAISGASARAQRLEEKLYGELVERVAERVDDLVAAAAAIAELDLFAGLAQVAAERNYVRPVFADESRLAISDGRHPVMEALRGTQFVPNDLVLRSERERFMLLTGPNMGGKSTFLRQAALLVILAQAGSFVPARAMTLGVVDRIFTRIGAGDDLASGQSTFYLEMAETANILRRSTACSLLLIDEVGRGTGTVDGLAIAQAICEYLLDLGDQSPMVLFATHFHELVALAERHDPVANYHVTAVESSLRAGVPVFSHRVLPGSTSRSFGIEVARMAGLPPAVLSRAKEIAEALGGRPSLETQIPPRAKLTRDDGRTRQLTLLSD